MKVYWKTKSKFHNNNHQELSEVTIKGYLYDDAINANKYLLIKGDLDGNDFDITFNEHANRNVIRHVSRKHHLGYTTIPQKKIE